MAEMSESGYKLLAINVILQAVEDYQGPNRTEVEAFLNTAWFEALADMSGIDPQNARKSINTGQTKKATIRRGEVCLL